MREVSRDKSCSGMGKIDRDVARPDAERLTHKNSCGGQGVPGSLGFPWARARAMRWTVCWQVPTCGSALCLPCNL